MKSLGTVVSLFDLTGNMVRPWIEAGYNAITVDLQRAANELGRTHIVADISSLGPDFICQFEPTMVFAFPPCTNLAVSGARWFKEKGLAALIDGLRLVEAGRVLCEAAGAPWMLENPVSTISTYWRKPDYTFHPHYFTAHTKADNYTKKTCLWTGGGFIMPQRNEDTSLGDPDDRIHKAAPGDERANFRSATPMGFAKAVFLANAPIVTKQRKAA